jgi:HlyD family secretion protein
LRRPDLAALVALAALLPGCSREDPTDVAKPATAAVARGALQITVTEGGALASAKPVKIVNEMEGRATIISLVKEGSQVKEGDVVVKLDSADVRDKINDYEVRVEQEDAALKQATEKHGIQLNQNDSDITLAALNAEFAKSDYEKYMGGEFPQRKMKCETDLIIAERELRRAQDRVVWSRRLEEKKFITRTELESDELTLKKAEIGVDLAKTALDTLIKFDFVKESRKLEAQRDEKSKELERVKRRTAAEAAKTAADVSSRKRTLELAQQRLQRVQTQLAKSVIRAPASGTVVYAREGGRWGANEPVSEGKQLHEREEILQIPDTRRMIVQLDIHESLVKKVREGQSASIRLDAIAGKQLTGKVRSVSSVPSTQNQWMNPDLKVYPTEIEIEQELEDLKPGMNAQVEIMVADLPDVLHVPMQAIQQSGGRAFAYVDRGGDPELKQVELGLNNDRFVVVKGGLEEGDRVFLSVPPGAPPLPAPERPAARTAKPAEDPAAAAKETPATPEGSEDQPAPADAGAAPTGSDGGGGLPTHGAGRREGGGRGRGGDRPARAKDP